MNKLNYLNDCLAKGSNVPVKKNGKFQVLCPTKDKEGDYRKSGWLETLEEAKQYISAWSGYLKEDLEEEIKYWEILTPFRLKVEPFKVGDKVQILDSIKENDNWDIYKNSFKDMIGEIKDVWNDIFGLKYLINGYYISHKYLLPLREEEEEEEEVTIKISKKSLEALQEAGIKIIK